MAHKTKIGDSFYEVTGGKAKIGTDVYEIKSGKTKIGTDVYDISFLLPPNYSELDTSASTYPTLIEYGGGYWTIGLSDNTLLRSTSIDGEWTLFTTNLAVLKCIKYANGYWVVGGAITEQSGTIQLPNGATVPQYASRPAIAYTTDITSGTWTVKKIYGSVTGEVTCITYANGYWVVGAVISNSPYVAYATNITSDTWSTTKLWTGTDHYNYLYDIYYANGYWVVGASSYYGSDINYGSGTIAYTTNITSNTWTIKVLWDNYFQSSSIRSIIYTNGYWLAAGSYSRQGSTTGSIAYTTDITGTWTTIDVWTGHEDGWSPINNLIYANGYYVASGYLTNPNNSSFAYACIAYSTSLTGPWTVDNLWSNTSAQLSDMVYAQGYFATVGYYWANGYNYYVNRLLYSSDPADFADMEF